MGNEPELTWIGMEKRPKREAPDKSYHAGARVGENDIFDNRLIFGDKPLASKALEQEFAGNAGMRLHRSAIRHRQRGYPTCSARAYPFSVP
jgi:hypothetical protein